MFEHRTYLPSVGFFLTLASGTSLIVNNSKHRAKIAWYLLAAVVVLLGCLTFARNQIWNNSMALWQDTYKKAPNKDLVLTNLAGEYMKLNRPDKALPLIVQALELSPYYMTTAKVYLGLILQYCNIEGTRFTTGEEIVNVRELKGRVALKREEELKLQAIMYNNLGLANEYLGSPAKSKDHYRSALKFNPDYDLAWYNLGLLAANQGDQGLAVHSLAQLQKLRSPMEALLAKTLVPSAIGQKPLK